MGAPVEVAASVEPVTVSPQLTVIASEQISFSIGSGASAQLTSRVKSPVLLPHPYT